MDKLTVQDICGLINCDECPFQDECDTYQEHLVTIRTERWKMKLYPELYDM